MARKKSLLISLIVTLILFSLSFSNDQYILIKKPFNTHNPQVIGALENYFDESDGFLVTGYLNPNYPAVYGEPRVYDSYRVVCADLEAYHKALEIIRNNREFEFKYLDTSIGVEARPSVTIKAKRWGTFAQFSQGTVSCVIQVLTVQKLRYMIWALDCRKNKTPRDKDSFLRYYDAANIYLARIDSGEVDAIPPKAVDYGLPEEYDFYAEPPDYVIQGYQNYKDFLHRHKEIKLEFARGITALIPTDSQLIWFKNNAPDEIFPNKEQARLQEEYREFFERGGDARIMQTLTRVGFDTLKSGEYFFAVGLSGKIRFGRELLREEVDRIEKETGRRAPRANHAFLFPGEPVLAAGAFFINGDGELYKVNAGSGHYFYSNITPTIKEDIAEKSNYYLLTLGHFFAALDNLGIPYDDVLISKL